MSITEESKKQYFSLVNPKYISWKFYKQYINVEPNFGELGLVVYLRTYSRFIEELNRREKWCETVLRVVEYSLSLDTITKVELKVKEAEELFDAIFNLRVFAAGRTLFTGNPNKSLGTAQFNCAFSVIESIDSYIEMLYLLQVGSGYGYSVENKYVAKLPVFNTNIKVTHKEIQLKQKNIRQKNTILTYNKNDFISYKELDNEFLLLDSDKCNLDLKGIVNIEVGDSKEGFCTALKAFLLLLTNTNITQIKFIYDSIRPEGERIKGFGGRAAGYKPYKLMIRKIYWRILNCGGKLSSIAAMDIANFIAEQVRVAGVRRSSQITLADLEDKEIINAKKYLWDYQYKSKNWGKDVEIDNVLDSLYNKNYDLWSTEQKAIELYKVVDNKYPQFRYQESRVMSNNSVMLYSKPSEEILSEIIDSISRSGEPGFINVETAKQRRQDFAGLNPCAEILLRSRGVCNLTTVNLYSYIKDNTLDWSNLEHGIKLATRMASRITNVDMWHPEWNKVQKEDRLLGVSFTGIGDTITTLNWSLNNLKEFFIFAKNVARIEADKYHQELNIPKAILALTIKPEGSISQLPTVSSGIHLGYAPLVQRCIRISSNDPMAKALIDLGVNTVPENGFHSLEDAHTWVLKFPVKYPITFKSVEESAIAQLERYKCAMQYYVEHNCSITVSVDYIEWNEVKQWLLRDENWKYFVGVAFIPKFDAAEGNEGIAPNLPYTTITQATYEELLKTTPNLSEEDLISVVSKYEQHEEEYLLDNECTTSVCPIR